MMFSSVNIDHSPYSIMFVEILKLLYGYNRIISNITHYTTFRILSSILITAVK